LVGAGSELHAERPREAIFLVNLGRRDVYSCRKRGGPSRELYVEGTATSEAGGVARGSSKVARVGFGIASLVADVRHAQVLLQRVRRDPDGRAGVHIPTPTSRAPVSGVRRQAEDPLPAVGRMGEGGCIEKATARAATEILTSPNADQRGSSGFA
jgi:hypothetical protein